MKFTVSAALPPLGWPILAASLLLTGVGLVAASAGHWGTGQWTPEVVRQAGHLVAGLVGFAVVQAVGYRRLGQWSYALFGVSLVLLVLLLVARKVPMQPIIVPRRNTYRWLSFGPINIQVSEYAKVAYILALAAYLRFRTNYRTFRGLLAPFVMTLVPVGLILKEPDLGTSLLLLPTLFIMLFVAGARMKHLGFILLLGALAAPAFYFSPLMNRYQRERIRSLFAQEEADPRWRLSSGYQLSQSKIALGSGQWTGHGLNEGEFFRHNLLPEEHNDFIFAVIGHQFGFLGCMGVLVCYLMLLAAGLTVASSTRDPLGRLLAVGVCGMFFAQTVINVGMTIGLMPITGMTLPFVSMGGSALVANYVCIGLLASVARKRPLDIAPEPFEFDDDAT